MNETLWARSARIIVPIDAISGIVLNIVLVVVLCRTDIGKSARVYRISIMITTVVNIFFSTLLLCLEHVFIIFDDILANVMYGPILNYLPERTIDIMVTAFLALSHLSWQLLPGSSVVQWMNLSRPESSTTRRLLFAYTVPVICNANAWYFMRFNKPDATLSNELTKRITALHGTDPRDYHLYGVRVFDDSAIDLLEMILHDVVPSFIVCYGIFIACAVQIQRHIRSHGNVASTKTSKMQKRFFRSQIIQVFMPLVLCAIPITIALVAALTGFSLANLSFILIYSLWIMPSATATLYLTFVVKSKSKKVTSNVSFSKVNPIKFHGTRRQLNFSEIEQPFVIFVIR